ncbi:MAG: hypothetical protein K9L62_10680 [Vallitaleaceae bacterium]|nr:hypothetical protein [Vallitaleaceae bacterium]
MFKIGDEVIVKSNNLNESEKLFGLDKPMYNMRGKKFIINKISVSKPGVYINNYWFANKDLYIEAEIKDKEPKIIHFNTNDLYI